MSDNSFWDDNPFGGIFDLNGDGKEDWGEQWIAYKVYEECTKEDNTNNNYHAHYRNTNYDGDDYVDTSWRDFCEDGSELGVYPEDFDTEEEYEEELESARYLYGNASDDYDSCDYDSCDYDVDCCEDFDEDYDEGYDSSDNYNKGSLDQNISVETCTDIHLSEITPDPAADISKSDYPNMRRYNAACALARYSTYGSSIKDYERIAERCKFILEKADTVIAANYLTHDSGFLYAQAIKDNFKLPVSLPQEDEEREIGFSQILLKIARKNIPLSFKIWNWCLEQFTPYTQHDPSAAYAITCSVINDIYKYPHGYKNKLVLYMNANPEFTDKVLKSAEEPAYGLPILIADALRKNLFELAYTIFSSGLELADGKWKLINDLTRKTIKKCKNYHELESIEYFRDNLFPLVKAINIGMVKDEIKEWEKDIRRYINQVESKCEKYAYTRKNAWRKSVPYDEECGLDPRLYDTESEYMDAYNNIKYGWRDYYKNRDTLGLDVNNFETHTEYRQAYDRLQAEKREKEWQERERIRLERRQKYEHEKQLEKLKMLEDKNIYTFCGVMFEGTFRTYHYRTDDPSIKVGDKVLVPTGDSESVGTVVSIGQYMRISAPFPLDKTKYIISRAGNTKNSNDD